jgi:hypothetical protein
MCLLRSRFHRKCTSSTQSVHVVKSWDKFTKQHQIELDLRKTPRQWLRCYVFEDISCDGDSCPNGTGGIKIVSTDCAVSLLYPKLKQNNSCFQSMSLTTAPRSSIRRFLQLHPVRICLTNQAMSYGLRWRSSHHDLAALR